MNIDENDDHIDKSQWLPKGEPIINGWRAAQLGITTEQTPTGEIFFAQAQINSIMNFLEAGRILTKDNVFDGQLYELWQICFTSMFQIKENKIYQSWVEREMRKELAAQGLDVPLFETVLRELPAKYKKLIDMALESGANDHKKWLAVRNAEHYQRAFGRLTEIMKRIRETYQRPGE